jgi:hypothetical protein
VVGRLAPGSSKDGGLRFGAGVVQGWYRARQPLLIKQAMKRWERLKDTKAFWV